MVKSFNCTKYLSTTKAGLRSTPSDDLDDVVIGEPDTCFLTDEVANAEVVGVLDVGKRSMCIKCNSTVEQMEATIETCSKCTMMQRLDQCPKEWSVKLVIRGADKLIMHTFTAFAEYDLQNYRR